MNREPASRTWSFPTKLIGDHVALAVALWLGFVVVIAVVVAIVSRFATIDRSVAEPASEVIRWFALVVGGYLGYSLLPLYVTHGATRRGFAVEASIFIVCHSVALAVLTMLTYAIERAAYALTNWPQRLATGDEHLFDSAHDLPMILVEYSLIFLVWSAVGAMAGAGIYRSDARSVPVVLLALVPLALVELARRSNWGPTRVIIGVLGDPGPLSTAGSVALCVAAFLLTLLIAWLVVRDLPIRSRPA